MAGLLFDSTDTVVGKTRATLLNSVLLCAQGDGALNGLAVTQRGAGVNMSVDVASGRWQANLTLQSAGATTNVGIDNGDANNRYDLIYADSAGNIDVVKGTASASNPQIPALIANSIPLAAVLVEANESTSILDADITDARCFLHAEVKHTHYVTSNQTEENVTSSGSALAGNMQSIVLTNAQTDYSELIVHAYGYGHLDENTGSRIDMHVFLYDGSGQLRNDTILSNLSGSTNYFKSTWSLHVVLVAGTDYTRGTGFTLSTRATAAIGAGDSATCYSSALIVEGVGNPTR